MGFAKSLTLAPQWPLFWLQLQPLHPLFKKTPIQIVAAWGHSAPLWSAINNYK